VASGLSRRWKRGPGLAAAFGPRQNAAGGAPQGERAATTRAPHPSRCGHRLVRLAALHLPSRCEGISAQPGRGCAAGSRTAAPFQSSLSSEETMSRPGKRRPRTVQRQGESGSEAHDLRPLCRALQFWRVCGKAPCRRALDCKGDSQTCFRHFWRQLPEEARVWFRAAMAARAGGLKNKAAGLAADAEVARWQELQQRYAPKLALDAPSAQPSVPAKPHDTTPASSPRIRSL
jgi:hypothetical protein